MPYVNLENLTVTVYEVILWGKPFQMHSRGENHFSEDYQSMRIVSVRGQLESIKGIGNCHFQCGMSLKGKMYTQDFVSETPKFQTEPPDPFESRRSAFPWGRAKPQPWARFVLSSWRGSQLRAASMEQVVFLPLVSYSSCACGGLHCGFRTRCDARIGQSISWPMWLVSFIVHRTPGLWGPIFLLLKISLCKLKREEC